MLDSRTEAGASAWAPLCPSLMRRSMLGIAPSERDLDAAGVIDTEGTMLDHLGS